METQSSDKTDASATALNRMRALGLRELVEHDLPAVAHIHRAAFPDRALSALGQRVVERYYAWQLLGPHERSARGVLLDEVLIGFCFAGVFHGSLAGFLGKNRFYLLRTLILRPWLLSNSMVLDRLRSAFKILHPLRHRTRHAGSGKPRKKSYGILAIAVDPAWQGLGAGKLLMEDCEVRARTEGFEQLHLTVDPQNHQAITFYERLQWVRVPAADGTWRGYMEKRL